MPVITDLYLSALAKPIYPLCLAVPGYWSSGCVERVYYLLNSTSVMNMISINYLHLSSEIHHSEHSLLGEFTEQIYKYTDIYISILYKVYKLIICQKLY